MQVVTCSLFYFVGFLLVVCFFFCVVVLFFLSRAMGSTEDEGDSVFPKVRLGYANGCLACICGKPAQQLFIF